jgi:hypothetical protein
MTMNIIFSPEVIAVVIGAILGIIITIVGFYINSTRGNRVVVIYKGKATLVKQVESIKSDLIISYRGDEIEQLNVYDLALENHGFKDISNLELRLLVKPESNKGFVELRIMDYLGKTESAISPLDEDNKYEIFITRPFINSRKRYKEETITLKIYSNEELKFNVTGGGEGWYSKIKTVYIENDVFISSGFFLLNAGFSFLLLVLSFIYSDFTIETNKFPANILKPGLLLLGIIFVVIHFVWKNNRIRRIEKKSLYF